MLKPDNWNIRLVDLIKEVSNGSRKFDARELEWSREYEKDLLGPNCRYPKQGDLYACIEEHQISLMTSWEGPYTGGGEGTLKVGEQIWINGEVFDSESISVYALPVNYKELETRFVDIKDLSEPKYSGYYFSVKTANLNSKFELIQAGFEKEPYK